MVRPDSLDNICWDRGPASGGRPGLRLRASWAAALCEQPLQLVDRDQTYPQGISVVSISGSTRRLKVDG